MTPVRERVRQMRARKKEAGLIYVSYQINPTAMGNLRLVARQLEKTHVGALEHLLKKAAAELLLRN